MLEKKREKDCYYSILMYSVGKTESAKYVLQYLTESYGAHNGQIEDRINKCIH